ncbi:MAG TPA: fumarylacetoacetate hydrolase family protein [Noviherbaspirillum sp.]|uniref:fumarylacetoacetate hydrolase family protein n=1 Tax=Noviherbaspirillum sp. TaxID=1926288 RepID=UPI002B4A1DBD|nr:fumarylacetoacetate hydrolase family protein [Noviherbaspirillum sp.]HJV86268.1 fumarylacetoacetate hydrolase family protein [Noviherbaspirillum sp.]
MPQNTSSVSSAASILAARRRNAEQGPRLPEWCRPLDVDTALAIQSGVTGQLGVPVRAWKCGTPSEGRVVMAPICAVTMQDGGDCPAIVRAGHVRVEPELAFILGKDLPARDAAYTQADVDAAIAETRLALELIDSRYSDPAGASFAENLADGLLNQGVFIGKVVETQKAHAAAAMPIRVTLESGHETLLDGRHPDGDPRAPLYWLAEFLRSRGSGLQAGQAVITGSYAGSFDLPVGEEVTLRYGDLGDLAVRFLKR